ncbi:MAG: peptide deformylase [Clostridiales bacterium]|nr:peptide deformylase [Clostridiales bacterium]
MIRPIMRDMLFLSQPSQAATPADQQVITDLVDTLNAHLDGCVGMAANMIGVKKRIIAVRMGQLTLPMVNPVIVRQSGPYEAEEGCLSLDGLRKCKRWQEIEVTFQDAAFLPRRQRYTGWIAQIIQHEMDHCNGVII